MGIPNAAEIMRLKARGRMEADMIATALKDALPLDREGMGSELYPFNDITNAESVRAVMDKIVRLRIPESPWNEAHKALLATDQNGKGYAEFMEAFRDVAFLVGVDYAQRSLPSWWSAFSDLDDHHRRAIGVIIHYAAQGPRDETGGEK